MSDNAYKIRKTCRLCNSNNWFELFHHDALPIAGLYLRKEELGNEKNLPLTVAYCRDCGLVQLRETINPDLYKNYSFAGSVSNQYAQHLIGLTKYLIDEWKVKDKNILEIGSSNGFLLKQLKEQGNNAVFGYEPSEKLAQESRLAGVPTTTNFFSSQSTREIPFAKIDAVIIRHVLEHIDDFSEILQPCAELLGKNGLLVIEIPSLEAIIKNKLYSNFFHEHLNYFSRETIEHLMTAYGFELLVSKEVDIHGGALLLVFKKRLEKIHPENEKPAGKNLEETISKLSNFFRDFVAYFRAIKKLVTIKSHSKKRLAGYGASHRTTTVLGMSGISTQEILVIYDKNSYLHNLYLPQSHCRIGNPHELVTADVDELIIFAISYENEIKKEVRAKNKKIKFISIKPENLQKEKLL